MDSSISKKFLSPIQNVEVAFVSLLFLYSAQIGLASVQAFSYGHAD